MIINRPDTTPRQAAEIFAETNWDEPRAVGCYLINPPRFQLVNGNRWYRVEMLPHYAGWEIVHEGQPTESMRA